MIWSRILNVGFGCFWWFFVILKFEILIYAHFWDFVDFINKLENDGQLEDNFFLED